MNTKQMLMIAGISVALVVIVVIVWHFFFRKPNLMYVPENAIENFSGVEDDPAGSDYRLLFFYANWCPHCKAAKPEMEKVKAELEKGPVNGKTVKLVEYDCTEPSPEMESIMDKYQVSSYPTILLVSSDGKVTPFENKPTKDAVMNFLNSSVH
jgi:protein disulfide-isomerase/protein disulfide isomerase family A protein 5